MGWVEFHLCQTSCETSVYLSNKNNMGTFLMLLELKLFLKKHLEGLGTTTEVVYALIVPE